MVAIAYNSRLDESFLTSGTWYTYRGFLPKTLLLRHFVLKIKISIATVLHFMKTKRKVFEMSKTSLYLCYVIANANTK